MRSRRDPQRCGPPRSCLARAGFRPLTNAGWSRSSASSTSLSPSSFRPLTNAEWSRSNPGPSDGVGAPVSVRPRMRSGRDPSGGPYATFVLLPSAHDCGVVVITDGPALHQGKCFCPLTNAEWSRSRVIVMPVRGLVSVRSRMRSGHDLRSTWPKQPGSVSVRSRMRSGRDLFDRRGSVSPHIGFRPLTNAEWPPSIQVGISGIGCCFRPLTNAEWPPSYNISITTIGVFTSAHECGVAAIQKACRRTL